MQNSARATTGRRSPPVSKTFIDETRKRPAYPIESVDYALRLLHEIVVCERLRVSEAAAKLGVAPSTAHRLLAMMQYHGFALQDPQTHEYVAGPDLVRLGLAAAKRFDLREQVRPTLERLSGDANETVHLGVLQGPNVFYIDGVECQRVLRIGSRVGVIVPLHCVSMGKALLAALPPERVDELYPSEKLPALTGRTVATKTELLKQLAAVRRRGYASSSGESNDEGVMSVSTALPKQAGDVRAAISIAAPVSRATPERIRDWVAALHTAAAEIGSRFSYLPA